MVIHKGKTKQEPNRCKKTRLTISKVNRGLHRQTNQGNRTHSYTIIARQYKTIRNAGHSTKQHKWDMKKTGSHLWKIQKKVELQKTGSDFKRSKTKIRTFVVNLDGNLCKIKKHSSRLSHVVKLRQLSIFY